MRGCTACQVAAFESDDAWKEHHRSDWHRYNLKRKVAELPPVDIEKFERKLDMLLTAGTGPKGQAHLKAGGGKLRDTFIDDKASVATSPPESAEAAAPPPKGGRIIRVPVAAAAPNVGHLQPPPKFIPPPPYEPTMCLFDNSTHDSPESNLAYMEKRYQFLVPEKAYIADVRGLLSCLGERLWNDHQCLFCQRTFPSLASVRNHMFDTSHTMLAMTSDQLPDEYHEYYDFSSSYKELIALEEHKNLKVSLKRLQPRSPIEDELEYGAKGKGSRSKTKLRGGERVVERIIVHVEGDASGDEEGATFEVADNDDDDGDWEDVEEVDEDDYDELGRKDATWDKVIKKLGLRYATITESGNLRLPNGKEVPPRQVAWVYKQRYAIPPPSMQSGAIANQLENIRRMKALRNAAASMGVHAGTSDNWRLASVAKQKQSARFQRLWDMNKQVRMEFQKRAGRDVRLGVKENKLNKSIKRDNLIII